MFQNSGNLDLHTVSHWFIFTPIINTPLGAQSRYDEYEIGKAAIKHDVPVFTTIAGAQAALRAIRITLNKKLTYTSLQKIFN